MFSLPFLFPNEETTTESNSTRKSATAINNRVTRDIVTQQQELDPTNQGVEVLKYYISEDESSSDNSSVMSYEHEEGSDESDSRFMSEQGELSFMALHHHQRVHVDSETGFLSPLKNDEDGNMEPGKITIGGAERRDTGPISPLDLTLQVKTVRSDEASLISSIGPGDFVENVENGAMSDASTSVDLNPYENGVSSPKMSAATRWRRNKNISDLERRNKRGRPKKDAIASKTSLTRQHILSNNNSAVRSSQNGSRKVDPEAPEKYYSPRLPPPPPPPLMTKKYSGSQFQISPEQSRASGKTVPSCRGSKPLLSGSMSATTNIIKAPKLHSAVVNETDEYVSFGNTFGDGLSTALSTETSNTNENHPEYRLILGSESPSRSRSRSIARTPTLSIGSRHPHEPNPLKQFIPLKTSASRRVATVSLSPGRATNNIAPRYRSTSSQVSRSIPRSDVTSFSRINGTRSRENDVEYKDSIPIIKPSPLLTSTNLSRDAAPREEQLSERKDSNSFTCESPSSGSKTRHGKSMFLDRLSEMKQSPPSKSAQSNLTAQSLSCTTSEQHCSLQTNSLSPPSILKNPIHRQRKKEWMSQMWCPENEEWDRVDLSLDDVRKQINFSTNKDHQVSIRKSVTKHAVSPMNKTKSLTDDDDSLNDILNSQGPPISDATSEVFSPSIIGDDNSSSLGISALKMSRSKNLISSEKRENESISGKVGDWNAFGEEDWTFSSSDGYISNAGSTSMFDDEWLHTNSSKATKTTDAKNARRNKKKNNDIENTIPFVRNTRGLKKSKINSLRKQIPQGQQESKWMVRHSGNDIAATAIQATFRGRSCRNRLIEKLGVAKRKKWESRGSRSARVTKIHSKIRRSARNRLRTRHTMNATDIYLASMVVSIRHICAATIQQWWKISKKSMGETRAMGFDSSAFPTAWTENKTSYDMFPDLFSDLISSQKYNRPNSRESTTPTSDTSTSRSENFDVEYYQKPQANFHDDEVDANLDMDDEAFVSQVSLLTKMQNGFVGRVLKIFKRHPIMKKKYGDSDESKPKKKKKKIRLKAFRKDKRKIKDTALEPVMIGDAQANEALPDPNSLYQPLEEDIEEEMAFRRLLSPHRETRKESNNIGNGDVDTLQFSPSGTRMKTSEHGLLTKQDSKINTAVHIVSPGAPPTGGESDVVLDDLEVDSNAVISNMMGSVELRNSTWEAIGSIEEGNVIKGTRTFESIPFDEI